VTRSDRQSADVAVDGSNGADLPLAAAAILVTLALFLPSARIGIDPHHDGLMLKPALDVLAGQTIFRDTFSQYGAGTVWLQAAAMGLFGATLGTVRVATVVAYAMAAGVLVLCWRLFLPRSLACCAFAFWLLLFSFPRIPILPWSSVYALAFQSLGLWFLLRAVGARPVAIDAGLAGASCAIAFLCRQPVGAVTFVAVVVSLLYASWCAADRRARLPALAWSLVGFGAPLAAFLLYLIRAGALEAWFLQTIRWPAAWAAQHTTMGQGLVACLLGPPMQAVAWLGLVAAALLPWRVLDAWPRVVAVAASVALYAAGHALLGALLRPPAGDFDLLLENVLGITPLGGAAGGIPLAVLAAAVAAGSRSGRPREPQTVRFVCASFVCLASWLQYYPLRDPGHVTWGLSPAIGLGIFVAWRVAGRRALAVAVVCGLVSVPRLMNAIVLARTEFAVPRVSLGGGTVLDGMRVPEAAAPEWRRLIDGIALYERERGRTAMLLEGRDALFPALTSDLSNPGPFYVSWDIPGVADDESRVRFIAARRPLIFVQRPPGSAVAGAITRYGYARLVQTPWGDLLAPGEDAAGTDSSAP
jgi:hypothetical protein